ncbi:MAG: hypothetical protein EA382_08390 [Spirochaetaceae bacterium]|nr:MAG: hypothetical protein EA382_08390 [Spirochaetaceae bacterium]
MEALLRDRYRQTLLGAVLTLLLLAAPAAGAGDRFTVRIGHTGAVRAIAYHPEHSIVYTVGDDGKMLVWDLSVPGLRRQIQLANGPITRIAHHPTRNQVVFYVRDTVTSGRLIAYDLDADTTLFVRNLDSEPVSLMYSPAGTFVVYALSGFQSLFFVGSQEGDQRPYLASGFGIVSFVQVARSERNIMTYVPSRGEFIYWELSTGRELQTVRTQSRLQFPTLIDPTSQRLLAAADSESLLIVDNLTGRIEARYPVAPVRGIAFSEANDLILVLTEQFGRPSTLAFQYRNGRLTRAFYQPQNLHALTQVISPAPPRLGGGFIGGSADGTVSYYASNNGRLTTLGGPPEVSASATALIDGRLFVTAGSELLTFESDLFAVSDDEVLTFSSLRVDRRSFERIGPLSIAAHGTTLYLWGPGEPGAIFTYDLTRRTAVEHYRDQAGSAIQTALFTDDGMLVVHRDGRVVVVPTDGQRFTYTATGVQDALWSPTIGLVIARASSGPLDAPILIVDPRTRETVPVDAPGFVAQRLAYSSETNTLYAIVLQGSPSSPTSRLYQIGNRGLERGTPILEHAGSPIGRSLVWDSRAMRVYTTMTGRVAGVSPQSANERGNNDVDVELDRAQRLATSISVASLVAATNADGTVSLWYRAGGTHLADVTLLPDGWLVTGATGFLSSGSRVERLLSYFPERETGRPEELADRRMELPLYIRPNL